MILERAVQETFYGGKDVCGYQSIERSESVECSQTSRPSVMLKFLLGEFASTLFWR
jgi:hypothetical protein